MPFHACISAVAVETFCETTGLLDQAGSFDMCTCNAEFPRAPSSKPLNPALYFVSQHYVRDGNTHLGLTWTTRPSCTTSRQRRDLFHQEKKRRQRSQVGKGQVGATYIVQHRVWFCLRLLSFIWFHASFFFVFSLLPSILSIFLTLPIKPTRPFFSSHLIPISRLASWSGLPF